MKIAFQDIINAVISENPDAVFRLPCEWNFQMGFESKEQLCGTCISQLKVTLNIIKGRLRIKYRLQRKGFVESTPIHQKWFHHLTD